jgi:hypothetical protein
MNPGAIRLDQAPPLWVPLSFFLTAPLALVAAGALLAANGAPALATGLAPVTLAIAHLGTLGFLTLAMMGALYQMTAVVAGSPVRRIRLGHVVHALFVTGVAALIGGLAAGSARAVFWAIALLALAVPLFVVPLARALLRAPARNETVAGMGIALVSFVVTAILGLWMAHGHGGMRFPGPRGLFIQGHLCVGVLGWVGGLVLAVSWQVLPMFYLSAPVARTAKRWIQGLAAAGALLPAGVLALFSAGALGADVGRASWLVAIAALPGVLAVWALHPLVSARSLRSRRRRRSDASLLFWHAALAVAPICALSTAVAFLVPDPRFGVLLGWLALCGWAGMVVHGMLGRIVPFLVWLHRLAPRVGEADVPSARGLLPDTWIRAGFALHAATLALGASAIALRSDALARAAGALLLATGLTLFGSLALVHLRARAAAPARTSEPRPPGRPGA